MILRAVALPPEEAARPGRYSVYAVCLLPDEGCQVERFMQQHRHIYPLAIQVLNTMLMDRVPQFGPPFDDQRLAKPLRDGACEFKSREKKPTPKAPRIAFFEDGRIIVCTNAFLKDTPGTTPESAIEECLRIRKMYLDDRRARIRPTVRTGWGV